MDLTGVWIRRRAGSEQEPREESDKEQESGVGRTSTFVNALEATTPFDDHAPERRARAGRQVDLGTKLRSLHGPISPVAPTTFR